MADMDKGLMALMGIEDDSAQDQGLAEKPSLPSSSLSQEAGPSSYFGEMSDSDSNPEQREFSQSLSRPSSTRLPSTFSRSNKTMTSNDATADTLASASIPPIHLDYSLSIPTTYSFDESTPSPPSYQTTATLPRASTSSLFNNNSSSKSISSPPSSSSPSLFGDGNHHQRTGTIRITKSPKKPKNKAGSSSMFSPTLSPRKPKKAAAEARPRFMSLSPSPPSSPSLRTPPAPASASAAAASPPTSKIDHSANNKDRAIQDMDLMSHEDPDQLLLSPSLRATPHQPPSSTRGPSAKELLEIKMEKERLLRSVPVKIKQRVHAEFPLADLLKTSQALLQKNKDMQAAEGQKSHSHDRSPVAATSTSTPPVPRSKPTQDKKQMISLMDSDEEFSEAIEQDNQQWKQSVTRALLSATHLSREKRLEIHRQMRATIVPEDVRQQIEQILQQSTAGLTPLSNKIQNLTLVSTSAGGQGKGLPSPPKAPFFSSAANQLPPASPSKSRQLPPGKVSSIEEYNLMMKRQLAKANLERRKKLEEEAKRAGTWKSPAEHAAEQWRNEEKRGRGLDPEEDEDDDEEDDEEEDPDYQEGGEAGVEAEAEAVVYSGEEEGDAVMDEDEEDDEEEEGEEKKGARSGANGLDLEAESGSDEDDEDDDVSDLDEALEADDEEEEEQVHLNKVKRQSRKKAVIGDEEDLKVVVVDSSKVVREDSEDSGDDDSDEIVSGSEDNDEDVSDIDQEMEGSPIVDDGTQGFGAFFESSFDPSQRSDKKKKMASFGRVLSEGQGNDASQGTCDGNPMDDALDFLSGKFPSQTQKRVASQSQGQSGNNGMDDALEFLSGKFPSQTQPVVHREDDDANNPFMVPATDDLYRSPIVGQSPSLPLSSLSSGPVPASFPTTTTTTVGHPELKRNAFQLMTNAMRKNSLDHDESITSGQGQGQQRRRLIQRQAKPSRVPISKTEKSAFIEYEAEEEEDEHMGKGGVDYESEGDNEDYDLGDGMVVQHAELDSREVENVRKLHMEHEQKQHDKEISDWVHGIAAGGVWRRRHGRATDDMDIFDEDDLDYQSRRRKKFKVTEKFEKLADNPSTAPFAKAFQKDMWDDQLKFLSDPDESFDESEDKATAAATDKGSTGGKSKDMVDLASSDEDDDDLMSYHRHKTDTAAAAAEPMEEDHEMGHHQPQEEEEEEEESLNSEKRIKTFERARLERTESMEHGSVAAQTREQALPFGGGGGFGMVSAAAVGQEDSSLKVAKGLKKSSPLKEGLSGEGGGVGDAIDEYKEALRRSKVIRKILDGMEEPLDLAAAASAAAVSSSSFEGSQQRKSSSLFNLLDRIKDSGSGVGSGGSVAGVGSGAVVDTVDVKAIVRPRMIRQSSSFVNEERRHQFLNTVGEDSRGANAGNRVVKEVNRRRMAFATTTTGSGGGSSSGGLNKEEGSLAAASGGGSGRKVVSISATRSSKTLESPFVKPSSRREGGESSVGGGGGGGSRLLRILSVEESGGSSRSRK